VQLSEDFKKSYRAYLAAYLPSVISQHSAFAPALNRELDAYVELASEEVALSRKNGLGLACDPSDLAERILRLDDGSEMIAGARFKNLDVSFPFVEIQKPFELTSSIMAEVQRRLLLEFRELKPKGFKFKGRPGLHPNLEKWSHVVFGEIKTESPTMIRSDLKFQFSKSLDWHALYVAEYKERLLEKRELRGFVRIGEVDEFAEAIADQALLLVTDGTDRNEEFAGVFAGIKNPLYGLDAIYMIESYLSKRHVGKGIAPVAHSVFLNAMAPNQKYIWGTIYDKNTSSLKTAQRTGREIIETEYFVPFAKSI
jgi:hypothetical protein